MFVTLFSGCEQLGVDDVLTPVPIGGTEENDAAVAIAWFEFYLRLVQETPGFSPPVSSRAFGYAGVTLYEAVVPGMPDYQTLAGQVNGLTGLPQPDLNNRKFRVYRPHARLTRHGAARF
jgi:hypothetical protein